MKRLTMLYLALTVFVFQSVFADLMSIRGVRPDFIFIFILYISIHRGSFPGMIIGFVLGVFIDILSAGSSFGLSSFTYVLTAYLSGFLSKEQEQLLPIHFHVFWVLISLIHFGVFGFIQYQVLFSVDLLVWIQKWLLLSSYTLGIIWVMQFVYPLKRI